MPSEKSKKQVEKKKPYPKNLDSQVKKILNDTTNNGKDDHDEEPSLAVLKKCLLDMKKKVDHLTQQRECNSSSLSTGSSKNNTHLTQQRECNPSSLSTGSSKNNTHLTQQREFNPSSLSTESGKNKTPEPQLNDMENEDDIDKNVEDSQLFGQYWKDDKMVLLNNDIFCKQDYVDMALGGSCKATHVARRLIEGVFKMDVLLSCTLTGQSPRAQGKDRQNQRFCSLNIQAKAAIIDFAIDTAAKKGWAVQSRADISRALSQKIGEIKRQHYRNNNLNNVTI